MKDFRERALEVLKRHYGYDSFRPMQLDIIAEAASGRDSIVLMPTGGGKSLCFQIPALMMPQGELALVVSPLISLMRDQVVALQANGIAAATINSAQPDETNRLIMEQVYLGQIRLLYVSPEWLQSFLPTLQGRVKVGLIAIDEAHCISQWGHDFRPVYTQLASLKQTFPDIPIMALTATADRITREDIVKQLNLRDPKVFISSFDRPNIKLTVVDSPDRRQKFAIITSLIDKYSQDSGIVYCLSRKNTEKVAAELAKRGYRVGIYHAGMSAADREASQRRFINGELQVVCATIAFGMGIDKSNIRWVVHYNLPKNIEGYYQEIGRAGRDGMPAEAVLFYSVADVITLRSFIEESGQRELNEEKLQRMQAFAEASVCRRRMLLSYFNEVPETDCGNCDVCNDPPERIDGTIIAMKAMSASARTGQNVGTSMLIDILRGSARQELVAAGYHQLKTYGMGRDLSASDWNYYIGQMIQLGLFEVAYNESNHLKITPYGEKILYGRAPIEFARRRLLTAAGPKRKKKAATETVQLTPDERLLALLKELRLEIAREEGKPAYTIFSDRSLADMAARRPTTRAAFAEVHGVGDFKLNKYWQRFTQAIASFV